MQSPSACAIMATRREDKAGFRVMASLSLCLTAPRQLLARGYSTVYSAHHALSAGAARTSGREGQLTESDGQR